MADSGGSEGKQSRCYEENEHIAAILNRNNFVSTDAEDTEGLLEYLTDYIVQDITDFDDDHECDSDCDTESASGECTSTKSKEKPDPLLQQPTAETAQIELEGKNTLYVFKRTVHRPTISKNNQVFL